MEEDEKEKTIARMTISDIIEAIKSLLEEIEVRVMQTN